MAGLGTWRVKDVREVFITFSEVKLKGLEALTNNIYHVHCSLQNLHQRAERLFFKEVRNSIRRWPVLYVSEQKECTFVFLFFCSKQRETLNYKNWPDFFNTHGISSKIFCRVMAGRGFMQSKPLCDKSNLEE
jgi:hypothetical protein